VWPGWSVGQTAPEKRQIVVQDLLVVVIHTIEQRWEREMTSGDLVGTEMEYDYTLGEYYNGDEWHWRALS
jgi:hypothetical protein